MESIFSRTDLSKKDKIKRLVHKIESRLQYFNEQVAYRSTSPYFDFYQSKLQEFETKAEHHLSMLESVGNYFHYNKTLGDIEKGEAKEAVDRRRKLCKWIQEREKTYRDTYDWVKTWKDRKEHIRDVLKIELPEEWFRDTDYGFLLKQLKETSFMNTVQCMKTRLMMQLKKAYDDGWFVSFGTLTVDPEHKDMVFAAGSDCWRNYIRKMQRECWKASSRYIETDEMGKKITKSRPWKESQGEDYFEYGSVVEEGTLTGQLHIHVLMFMKKPVDCKDPNYGLKIPYKREIDEWEWFWPYGISQYIAVRYSNSDPWGRKGWIWPVDTMCQPIQETSTIKLAQYMVKYILKSKLNSKGKVTPWRTRCSQGMGKMELRNTMTTMTKIQLEALIAFNVYPRGIKLLGQTVPAKLIRDIALDKLLMRYKSDKKNLVALRPDIRLKMLLKNGKLKRHNRRSRNSGSIIQEIFSGRVISDDKIHVEFMVAKGILEKRFPTPSIGWNVSGGKITGKN